MPQTAEAGIEKLATRLDKLYEFEREPVTPDKLHDGRYFAAMFAGEHLAGTEFVIGALFVQWGASARDLVWGLVLGNFLAVLSWAFICAPIAVNVRLTLYWYVRRIIGPGLTVVYNLVNALLYCCLASAMIGVSASAVIMGLARIPGLPHIRHPALSDAYPNSVGWVVIVLLVGALVVLLAIAGFKRFSQFSAVCSPWMFPIFLAGALATLPHLGEFHNAGQLWRLLETKVWTGVPAHGGTRLGFWHITFFAWFCCLAMHIGLSDMAIFRYARRWTYGFYSGFGMFLGHFCAWICAGIMGAVLGSALNPGEMADRAAGLAGLLCVLLAGWTTANPTIYRAGLALQTLTPNWPRWLITLVAGGITTVVACFPAIFMRLLDFVAIYGLVLMPVGAIIFAEHWLFPRVGLRQYWTERTRRMINPAALATWAVVLAICFPIEDFTGGRVISPLGLLGMHLFFRWLPGWFLSVALYMGLCCFIRSARKASSEPGEPHPLMASHQGMGHPAMGHPATGHLVEKVNARRPVDGLMLVGGGVAFVALVACVALPTWVALGGSAAQTYSHRLEFCKSGLGIATLVYFVFATWYVVRRERASGGM